MGPKAKTVLMAQSIEQEFASARCLLESGDWLRCSQILRRILAAQPQHAGALHIMGLLAQQSGNLQLAQELQTQAARFDPHDPQPLFALANLLILTQRFNEAEAAYLDLINRLPPSAIAWTNLANVYRLQSKMDEAISAYQSAIQIDPHYAPAHSNLGNVLKDLGQIDSAIAAFKRAVELDPSSAQIHSNLVYAANFSDSYDALQILSCAREWADRFEQDSSRPAPLNMFGRRIRVGYLSPDFRDHVVGRNVLPVLENHDRREFDIHAFSTLAIHDPVTPRFIRAVEHWHECAHLNDDMLATKIRQEPIDLLVDLTLHMAGNRLKVFTLKPAPIQVTWAGYPGTTGLRSIDYRITDPHIDPPGTDAFSSETSSHLPDSFWCYRPQDSAPIINDLPAQTAGFLTFGCLNQPAKISSRAIELWARILASVPNSRMVILLPVSRRRAEIADVFQSLGITADRLNFIDLCKPDQHMARYHQLDISLDPMPYTGHTSTLDSLWMGVPVITLAGQTSVSRGSITGLTHVGLTDLIANNEREYLSIATKLASDFERLAALRASLRQKMSASPLCDEKRFTKNLEHAYRFQLSNITAHFPVPATAPPHSPV